LTCTAGPGRPRIDRHRTNPIWHPSGQYVVLQAELDDTPLGVLSKIKLVSELVLNGVWNDLYAVTPDGQRWFKLTSTTTSTTDGVLGPTFSPDGRQLLWTHLVAPTSSEAPWGRWRLMLGELAVADGTPALRNVKDITPQGAKFVETGGFSPDGRSIVLTGDMTSQGQWDPHIWTMSLASGALTDLTPGAFYNEHGRFSPSGRSVT
jgi:Tol biopolymer transport system component